MPHTAPVSYVFRNLKHASYQSTGAIFSPSRRCLSDSITNPSSPLLSVFSSESPCITEAPDWSGRWAAALGSGEKRVSVPPPFTLGLRFELSASDSTNGRHMHCPVGYNWGCSQVVCHTEQPGGGKEETAPSLLRCVNVHPLYTLWSFWCAETKTWKIGTLEYISETLMKTDIFPLLLPLSVHLIDWRNTGEKEALFDHGTHSSLRILGYCVNTVSVKGLAGSGSIIWTTSRYPNRCSLRHRCISSVGCSCHLCIFAQRLTVRGLVLRQPASRRRMRPDWWSNMFFSVQLRCHTWATRNKQELSVWQRERGGERERADVFLYSESAINLTCSQDLIYVNSTCGMWDKAFNTSDRNFMAYLLWKYCWRETTLHSVSVEWHSRSAQLGILQSWLADCQMFTSPLL